MRLGPLGHVFVLSVAGNTDHLDPWIGSKNTGPTKPLAEGAPAGQNRRVTQPAAGGAASRPFRNNRPNGVVANVDRALAGAKWPAFELDLPPDIPAAACYRPARPATPGTVRMRSTLSYWCPRPSE